MGSILILFHSAPIPRGVENSAQHRRLGPSGVREEHSVRGVGKVAAWALSGRGGRIALVRRGMSGRASGPAGLRPRALRGAPAPVFEHCLKRARGLLHRRRRPRDPPGPKADGETPGDERLRAGALPVGGLRGQKRAEARGRARPDEFCRTLLPRTRRHARPRGARGTLPGNRLDRRAGS